MGEAWASKETAKKRCRKKRAVNIKNNRDNKLWGWEPGEERKIMPLESRKHMASTHTLATPRMSCVRLSTVIEAPLSAGNFTVLTGTP